MVCHEQGLGPDLQEGKIFSSEFLFVCMHTDIISRHLKQDKRRL